MLTRIFFVALLFALFGLGSSSNAMVVLGRTNGLIEDFFLEERYVVPITSKNGIKSNVDDKLKFEIDSNGYFAFTTADIPIYLVFFFEPWDFHNWRYKVNPSLCTLKADTLFLGEIYLLYPVLFNSLEYEGAFGSSRVNLELPDTIYRTKRFVDFSFTIKVKEYNLDIKNGGYMTKSVLGYCSDSILSYRVTFDKVKVVDSIFYRACSGKFKAIAYFNRKGKPTDILIFDPFRAIKWEYKVVYKSIRERSPSRQYSFYYVYPKGI